MQNDFIYGSLRNEQAIKIIPNVKEKIMNFDGVVLYTRDTHKSDYLDTLEGKKLPVIHCIENTKGWEIIDELKPLISEKVFNKPTFGSIDLACYLEFLNKKEKIDSIEIIGVCTDICVISNAIVIKTHLPQTKIIVDSKCCAGVSIKSHENALEAMKSLQIDII